MTIAIPETSEELEELLNDSTQLAAVSQEGQLGDFVAAYVRKRMEAKGGELATQIRAAAQTGIGEWLKDTRDEGFVPSALSHVPADPLAGWDAKTAKMAARMKLYSKRAIGAQVDKLDYAASIGTFLQAIWHRAEAQRPGEIESLRNFRKTLVNALSERVPSQGGFLVPEVLRSQILMVALEHAVVRPRARIIPMDSLRVPYPTIDDTSHTANVFGGVTGYWTEEAAALTASQPAFGRIELEAKKLTAYTEIPNELLQDAVEALDQWFTEMFPIAIAWFEDVAFITGSGTGQPQGYQNAPCAVTVTRATSNKIRWQDIAGMYPRMIPASLNSAVWLVCPNGVGQLLQLAVTEPGGTTVAPPVFLSGFQAQGAPDMTLLGRPVIVTEKHPALGSTGDLAFVDFGYYLLGDRQAMQISSSEHYKFANDLTAFRITERLDGRTWIQSAITPENNDSTLSPVVLLHS